MSRRPTVHTNHSNTHRRTRLTALLVACSLLLGVVLGSGWMRTSRTVDSLSNSLITQMILQDICRGHPESQLTGGIQTATNAAEPNAAAATQATATGVPIDGETTPVSVTDHSHCAACLIALDIALPQHGGTWRLKAAQLALQRTLTAHAPVAVKHRIKPPSHAPPTAV